MLLEELGAIHPSSYPPCQSVDDDKQLLLEELQLLLDFPHLDPETPLLSPLLE